jgi:hypothetical protein
MAAPLMQEQPGSSITSGWKLKEAPMGKIDVAREKQVTKWPKYEALEGGLRNYWYPVMLSRRLRRKPLPMELFGENIVFVRDRDRVFALDDRCPHRGTPLHFGKRDFPGTLTCIYHGWCFDLVFCHKHLNPASTPSYGPAKRPWPISPWDANE